MGSIASSVTSLLRSIVTPRARIVITPVLLAVVAAACAGGTGRGKSNDFMPLPEKLTLATVVGPMCDGEICKCIEPGDDPGLPDQEGVKRYQFKLGPTSNEMWVKVDDMILYKGVERATECFILDLRAGKHPMVVRAGGKSGFSVGIEVNEIGPKGLYDTFGFQCGGSDPCTFDYIDEFKASLAKYKRGVHDPCGSTRIRGLEWLTGGSDDRVHPGDVQVSLILDAYDFAPEQPSGHDSCKDRY